MRNRWLLPALLLGLGLLALTIPTSAADKPSDAEIAKLIKQLGSDEYAVREKASEALDKIGAPALEALRKAIKDGDAEISRRAEDLVGRIEKRGETASILAAKKVKLAFKDTPVPQAVEELRKQSGYNIVLQDPKNTLKDRKVTLDTGEVSFWEALDRLCEKAGLVEAEQTFPISGPPRGGPIGPGAGPAPGVKILPVEVKPVEVKPVEPKTAPAKEKGKIAVDEKAEKPAEKSETVRPAGKPAIGGPAVGAPGIGVVAKPGPGIRPIPIVPDQITLTDGKPAKLPSDYSSAVRVRALAKSDMFGKAAKEQILLALQATPEPKIKWQNLVQVKINKAIDDQDQKLEQTTAPAIKSTDPTLPAGPGGFAPGAPGPGAGPAGTSVAMPFRPGFGMLHQNIPVYLKKGSKESKSLKELSGVITAQVLAPAKAFITVEDVMKAAGKTITGTDGGSIKVIDVSKDKNGNITIRCEVEAPAGITPAGGTTGGWGTGVPTPAPVPLPKKGAVAPGAKPALRAALAVDLPAPAPAPGVVPGVKIAVGRVDVVAVPNYVGLGGNGLSLLDAKGNAVNAGIGIQGTVNATTGKVTQVHTFTVPAGSAEPAKLVFMGQKQTTIDIPFTLKNVTLP